MRRSLRVHVLVLGVLLVCGGSTAAQGLAVGLRGGVNFANVSFDGDDAGPSLDRRMGVVAGGFVTLPLISWLDVQPELLYSSKGAQLDEEGIQSKLVLDYLELPVLGRVSGAAPGGTRFYVVAGPTVSFRLRAKTRTEFGNATEERDISDEVERLDIGLAAGAGLEFRRFVIDGRYTHGLSDIDSDTTDAVKISTRVFSLTAGIRF